MKSDSEPLPQLTAKATREGRDPRTRRILYGLTALWLVTLIALVAVAWNAYFDQKEKAQTLAQQIDLACELGTFGPPDFTPEDTAELCSNARRSDPKAPVLIPGPEGPQGIPGINGVDGTDGKNGQNGANGSNGQDGSDGEDGDPGSNGQDGTNGTNGVDGAPGETGPAGPAGPPGPQGAQGAPGVDGQNAYPFTFSFTVGRGILSRTYTCIITDPDTPAVCE